MNLHYNKLTAIQSAFIYAAGDTVASVMTNSFSYSRMAGVAVIGATLYSIEIPNYFRWINTKTESLKQFPAAIRRTLFAMIFFNPLWISRHLILVQLCAGNTGILTWSILDIGLRSFILNIPISAPVNFFIQNNIPLKRRFLASSLFSAVMAVYYALSQVWFE